MEEIRRLDVTDILIFLKKKRSTVLKENLQSALASKNQEVEVVIDVNHGDLQFLKREGVNLFLIPEDIASYMDYSGINMEECFQLTHDEYENGNVDRIVKYIEKKIEKRNISETPFFDLISNY